MTNRNINNESSRRKNAVYTKAVGICDKCLGKNTKRTANVFNWRCSGELVAADRGDGRPRQWQFIVSFHLQGASACPQVPPHNVALQSHLNLLIAHLMNLGYTEVSDVWISHILNLFIVFFSFWWWIWITARFSNVNISDYSSKMVEGNVLRRKECVGIHVDLGGRSFTTPITYLNL